MTFQFAMDYSHFLILVKVKGFTRRCTWYLPVIFICTVVVVSNIFLMVISLCPMLQPLTNTENTVAHLFLR